MSALNIITTLKVISLCEIMELNVYNISLTSCLLAFTLKHELCRINIGIRIATSCNDQYTDMQQNCCQAVVFQIPSVDEKLTRLAVHRQMLSIFHFHFCVSHMQYKHNSFDSAVVFNKSIAV